MSISQHCLGLSRGRDFTSFHAISNHFTSFHIHSYSQMGKIDDGWGWQRIEHWSLGKLRGLLLSPCAPLKHRQGGSVSPPKMELMTYDDLLDASWCVDKLMLYKSYIVVLFKPWQFLLRVTKRRHSWRISGAGDRQGLLQQRFCIGSPHDDPGTICTQIDGQVHSTSESRSLKERNILQTISQKVHFD